MFDSVNVNNIPKDAKWVAGYVNGIWPTYHDLVKSHPNAQHVSITINASEVADVLDVEKGDATPSQAPVWAKAMRAKGHTPIIYTSLSNVSTVREEFTKVNEAEPMFWVADWTNSPHLVPGSIATQWADGTEAYPGLAKYCDTSTVSPNWPKHKTPIITKITKEIKKPMQVKHTVLWSIVRQLAAYAGIATQIANTSHLPTNVRAAIIAASGAIITVEHYVTK